MRSQFLYDVFLSHSSKNQRRVKTLAERLKSDGLNVWLDSWSVEAGENIVLAIEEGLKASRVLVLFLSPAFLQSEWSHYERSVALFRDPNNRQRRLIPTVIEDCEIPESLRLFRYLKLQEESEEAYQQLLTACRRAAEGTLENPPRGNDLPSALRRRRALFPQRSLPVSLSKT